MNEILDLTVVKEQVFEIRVQQPQIRHRSPIQQRLLNLFAGLDDSFRNAMCHW
jgi:hypothetical protein